MTIKFDLYPEGKHKAMTFSYDDGREYDLRLARIFDFSGIKGTFHLNASFLGDGKHLTADEVKTALAAHEVSCHTYTHPFPTAIPPEMLTEEIMTDRRVLEKICGYPIRGMSYPYGDYNDAVIAQLKMLGMRYSRTTKATEKFSLPADFMLWHPTCHHSNPHLFELLEKFRKTTTKLALFYIWGHSYEFPRDDNWALIEKFCTAAADDPDVWYATNIEIYDYVMALRALSFSADCTMVYNPTATDVWISADGAPVRIAAGATVHLNT
ncbi:MAG: polysaccharide deacetylase family protein [Clostridia bacterium]|nr:polysaccharide deacetylase family protein [Clostridia bacterium]